MDALSAPLARAEPFPLVCAVGVELFADDWVFSVQFQAIAPGMSSLELRRETDAQPFALSFADICGTEAFKKSNEGIDEIKNAVVMVSPDCNDVLFFDTFGTGDTSLWAGVSGS